MSNQPNIKSSNPQASSQALISAQKRHGDMLTRLAKTLDLPEDYQANLFALHGSDRDEYGVEISGPGNFEYTIMRTPVPGNLDVICGTLSDLFDAADAAKADSQRRINEATPWHSRYDGIERPHLVASHDPGWMQMEGKSTDGTEVTHKIFASTFEPLDLHFDIWETDGDPISVGMGAQADWEFESHEELLKLGDQTGELAKWLDDCATVTAWVKDHDTVKDGESHE